MRIEPADIRKKGKVPKNASLFFTIFQTFMSGQSKDGKPSPYFGDYPPDFFDFIVIDECHRGGANDESNWRSILEYFAPAVQLGLTATPRDHVDHDTFALFDCHTQDPTFAYSFDEAIRHDPPYLCDFELLKVRTKFQVEGIRGPRLDEPITGCPFQPRCDVVLDRCAEEHPALRLVGPGHEAACHRAERAGST